MVLVGRSAMLRITKIKEGRRKKEWEEDLKNGVGGKISHAEAGSWLGCVFLEEQQRVSAPVYLEPEHMPHMGYRKAVNTMCEMRRKQVRIEKT